MIDAETMRGVALDPVVEAAVRDLVRVSKFGGSTLVSLPLFYPTGTNVGVYVIPTSGAYVVTDFGLGFRECESFGADRSFSANVRRIVDAYGLEYGTGHQIRVKAKPHQLVGAIQMVASASSEVVAKVFSAAPQWDEEEVTADLYQRLVGMFGKSHVRAKASIAGASSVSWPVAARVTLNGRDILFDVVSDHHSSVFSTVSKFNDLSRLDRPVVEVAVVESKIAMGKWLPLLSQVATVIERDVTDDTIRDIVAEAA